MAKRFCGAAIVADSGPMCDDGAFYRSLLKKIIEMIPFIIEKSTIPKVFELSKQIPEFVHKPKPLAEYYERLHDVTHLILVAKDGERLVGYKVGYDRYGDGSLYSWLGAVVPEYRGKGIATLLAIEQERWAKKKGFESVRFKTLNRFKNMLCFALNRGFYVTDFKAHVNPMESAIFLRKVL